MTSDDEDDDDNGYMLVAVSVTRKLCPQRFLLEVCTS